MHQYDMYAVMYKRKHSNDWNYVNNNIIISQSDIISKNYKPQMYLNETRADAHKMYLYIIKKYDYDLDIIKISRMNKYLDNEKEMEVLTYREFD